MKLFVCHRSKDEEKVSELLKSMQCELPDNFCIQREMKHTENWKKNVEKRIDMVDAVLFVMSVDTFSSEAIKWEFAKSKQIGKQVLGLFIGEAFYDNPLSEQGYSVFHSNDEVVEYLKHFHSDNRELLIEQYKMMVNSTEKVTEQRLKVHNLFFTVTSTLLSLSLVVGKSLGFTKAGIVGMLVIAAMVYITTFFWQKLIESYGKLNKGKFQIIDQIEKQLQTNMFEREWNVLVNEIKYESNTVTESNIVKNFRYFVLFIGISELCYLAHKVNLLVTLKNIGGW